MIAAGALFPAFYHLVLKGQWGFAIDANVSLNEHHYGHSLTTASAFLITEEGIGYNIVYEAT